ncbi:cystinosin-like isoform X1 [Tubulanus polymorphus]|uniref:cystinosin-like isoform X1 n=1 Tax=Tubulanus polymorphus TaxID=672921 RepID=UPI003DA46FC0
MNWMLCFVLLHSLLIANAEALSTIHFSQEKVILEVWQRASFELILSEPLVNGTILTFIYDEQGKTSVHQETKFIDNLLDLTIPANVTGAFNFTVKCLGKAGHLNLELNSTSHEIIRLSAVFMIIEIIYSRAVNTINDVFGWVYVIAWSASSYPQIVENYQRKSVIGLSFDYTLINSIGFSAYSLYNVGMLWIPAVIEDYQNLHQRDINPVQINDVCFALHGLLCCYILIIQCFIYERGNQKLSWMVVGLSVVMCLYCLVLAVLTACDVFGLSWFTCFLYISYVKILVTLIKYAPQALLNYRRKSTNGFNIYGIIGDMIGGIFSILQLFLLAYNNDAWNSLFGDFTKFALGIISFLYDILFMVQHYILYRNMLPLDQRPQQDQSTVDKMDDTNEEETHDDHDDLSPLIV